MDHSNTLKTKPLAIFTVDVEDWFHILDTEAAPPLPLWESLPSRVEANMLRLLDIFGSEATRVTFFFLGWVAERYPHLVKEATRRGHEEIASHGYAHQLVYRISREQFLTDVSNTRKLLQDLSGTHVLGYRAPGFSLTSATPYYYDVLLEAGYEYDSSLFPARRAHGGLSTGKRNPHRVSTASSSLVEFPISVADVLQRRMCFFGGGYLRLFPYSVVRRMARQVSNPQRFPLIFYIHPREIDPQPATPSDERLEKAQDVRKSGVHYR